MISIFYKKNGTFELLQKLETKIQYMKSDIENNKLNSGIGKVSTGLNEIINLLKVHEIKVIQMKKKCEFKSKYDLYKKEYLFQLRYHLSLLLGLQQLLICYIEKDILSRLKFQKEFITGVHFLKFKLIASWHICKALPLKEKLSEVDENKFNDDNVDLVFANKGDEDEIKVMFEPSIIFDLSFSPIEETKRSKRYASIFEKDSIMVDILIVDCADLFEEN
ncbi:hypothetical protein K502DRAFT_345465 [Neoconidiobolus thromboides FSU 785]|nr:hypothetical protein K502DRAFT_345465 [Neoconidiobolus thromboides FSU 785]